MVDDVVLVQHHPGRPKRLLPGICFNFESATIAQTKSASLHRPRLRDCPKGTTAPKRERASPGQQHTIVDPHVQIPDSRNVRYSYGAIPYSRSTLSLFDPNLGDTRLVSVSPSHDRRDVRDDRIRHDRNTSSSQEKDSPSGTSTDKVEKRWEVGRILPAPPSFRRSVWILYDACNVTLQR